jgi:hypothetical protein
MWLTNAKSCFILCYLFPEDAKIKINELVRHCMARGVLLSQNPRTLVEARTVVQIVVDALKSASLLLSGGKENNVRIHDVIRDVGIAISCEEQTFVVVE